MNTKGWKLCFVFVRVNRSILLGLLDISQSLLTNIPLDSPCSEHMALSEKLLHLFKGTANGFWEHEKDMDKCGKVEGAEDEVCLVGDGRKTWWYCEGEGSVEEPV